MTAAPAGWIISGVVFWLMALGGLIPGLMAIFNSLRGPRQVRRGGGRPIFDAPIVRANVDFERNMPGDPMLRDSPIRTKSSRPAAQARRARRAGAERHVDTTNDFVDPVTGEKIKPGGNDA